MKRILVMDGQGGRIGQLLIESINGRLKDVEVIAVGTNSIATANMIKSGAKEAATGENPVVVNAPQADIIVGPVGIVIADSLLGEVTPKMALAVGQSPAKRILLPMNRCDNMIPGIGDLHPGELVREAVDMIEKLIG